jgi:hypothetical protein
VGTLFCKPVDVDLQEPAKYTDGQKRENTEERREVKEETGREKQREEQDNEREVDFA